MLGWRRFLEAELKIPPILIFLSCLALPGMAWPQEAPIKLDLAPLLTTLRHRTWYGTSDTALADAVLAAISKAQFQPARGPAPDVLTLSAPDGVKKDNDEFSFTVVFSRDGTKLGEAVEYCPTKKLSDCTDQLVLDVKTAAQ